MKVLLLLLSCFVSMNLYALGQQKEGIEPKYSAESEELVKDGKNLDQYASKTTRGNLLSSLATLLSSKDSILRKKTLRYCLRKEYGDKQLLPFIYKTLKNKKIYPDGNEVYLSVLFMETYPDVRSIPILIDVSNKNPIMATGYVETSDGKRTRMGNFESIFPYIARAISKCSNGKIENVPLKDSFGRKIEWALYSSDRNKYVTKWKKWWDEHGVIEMKKQNATGNSVKEWVELLNSGNDRQRRIAMKVLSDIGQPAINDVVKFIKNNTDDKARLYAMYVFDNLPDLDERKKLKAFFFEVLQLDKSQEVRAVAARSLRHTLDESDVSLLLKIIKSEKSALVVTNIINLFGYHKARGAVSVITSKLHGDKSEVVRESAASALGNIQDKRSLPALIKAMKDKSAKVRFALIGALRNFSNEQIIPVFIFSLKDTNVQVRRSAAIMLENVKIRRFATNLVQALYDKDYLVRAYTVIALGNMNYKRGIPDIIKLLSDDMAFVRAEAKKALVKLVGQSFGADASKWREWWEKNKDHILKEEAEKERLEKEKAEKE